MLLRRKTKFQWLISIFLNLNWSFRSSWFSLMLLLNFLLRWILFFFIGIKRIEKLQALLSSFFYILKKRDINILYEKNLTTEINQVKFKIVNKKLIFIKMNILKKKNLIGLDILLIYLKNESKKFYGLLYLLIIIKIIRHFT